MKVRDLLDRLSKLDPNMNVLCRSEDEELFQDWDSSRLLEIQDVQVVNATVARDEDRIVRASYSDGPEASKTVFLELTGTF